MAQEKYNISVVWNDEETKKFKLQSFARLNENDMGEVIALRRKDRTRISTLHFLIFQQRSRCPTKLHVFKTAFCSVNPLQPKMLN